MLEMRNNYAGADFNYDHRMLIPKKTYQATKKSLLTNYRKSVLGGAATQDHSLSINQASLERRYDHFFLRRDQESQVFKANVVSVPIPDDGGGAAAAKVVMMSETDMMQSPPPTLTNINPSKQHDFRVVIHQNIDGQRAEN